MGDPELERIQHSIRANWITMNGEVEEFERLFAEFCGVRHAIGTCNGTAALHLALIGAGVDEGDEVLVPDLTYVATANAAFLLEAKETARAKEVKARLCAHRKVFAVNVVNEAWRDSNVYKKAIAATCEHMSCTYGCRPVFFCNEVRSGRFFDFEANRETAT
ncbi:unnamed protein product [marine sediment metagenome]|uniref:Uncharacterized protein n=1 Tax=marine sediment metagenome TaxID=412755 RepID=X0U8X1_9ZZZZ